MNNISAINGFESNKIALILKNINFKIDKKELLKNISFRVIKRKITVIMGANGSGKSLCLKLITGLLKPSSGLIDFNKNLQIGYVPQKVVFLRRNVYQNLIYSLKILSKPKNIINERIRNL